MKTEYEKMEMYKKEEYSSIIILFTRMKPRNTRIASNS